ncbi:hypothetical protein OWM54_28540 [Myxococcus sp. MISCRS1]|uniref:hypothetical protein n=1 Tax=Myxococcus sp. MISCRS1 TaxID=2996786 RepID=UPI00226D67A7|nr:hypothetical protein [Myxococcus sp. MISCRS1]MCY1001106.1 hypothetical protein [Myxococcus sp. MISCRS1]
MKLPLMAAVAALTFWGCSSHSASTRPDSPSGSSVPSATGGSGSVDAAEQERQAREDERDANESPGEAADVVDNERRDRGGAPTIYDNEATGGSGTGTQVTTPDGEKWDVMEEPGGSEPRDSTEGTGGSGVDAADGTDGSLDDDPAPTGAEESQ